MSIPVVDPFPSVSATLARARALDDQELCDEVQTAERAIRKMHAEIAALTAEMQSRITAMGYPLSGASEEFATLLAISPRSADHRMGTAVALCEREVVWGLVERVVDLEWTTIGSARETTSETECRMWRAQIRRLRGLLLNSADDVAEFRKVGSPVIGVIIRPHDKTADKIGRMSRINLYAQEMAAVALRLAALNPLASPSERHAAVTKSVSVLALNYQPAETSEWAEKVIELTNDPEGGAKVLGIDTEAK